MVTDLGADHRDVGNAGHRLQRGLDASESGCRRVKSDRRGRCTVVHQLELAARGVADGNDLYFVARRALGALDGHFYRIGVRGWRNLDLLARAKVEAEGQARAQVGRHSEGARGLHAGDLAEAYAEVEGEQPAGQVRRVSGKQRDVLAGLVAQELDG